MVFPTKWSGKCSDSGNSECKGPEAGTGKVCQLMPLWPEQREQRSERVEVAMARSHRAVAAVTVTWGCTLSGFGAGCDMTRVMFLKPHSGCGV